MEMTKEIKKMKLEIELVPSSSWENNLRNIVPKTKWDQIRRETYAKFDNKCGICNADGKMSCHEIWEYDDDKHIQKLKGFIALCFSCHIIKHIGMAGILAQNGKLDYRRLIEHYIKVNGCDLSDFEIHMNSAFVKWKKRSKYNWQLVLSLFEYYPSK